MPLYILLIIPDLWICMSSHRKLGHMHASRANPNMSPSSHATTLESKKSDVTNALRGRKAACMMSSPRPACSPAGWRGHGQTSANTLGEIRRIARRLRPGVDVAQPLEVRKGPAGVQPASLVDVCRGIPREENFPHSIAFSGNAPTPACLLAIGQAFPHCGSSPAPTI